MGTFMFIYHNKIRMQRKTFRKHNLLTEKSDGTWTTDLIRNQIIGEIIFWIFNLFKDKVPDRMCSSPVFDNFINRKDNNSTKPDLSTISNHCGIHMYSPFRSVQKDREPDKYRIELLRYKRASGRHLSGIRYLINCIGIR